MKVNTGCNIFIRIMYLSLLYLLLFSKIVENLFRFIDISLGCIILDVPLRSI
jgi:hypothetical protein